MENDMNYLKISSIAWVALLAMISFTFECAGLTIEIDPLLVIFLEGNMDKSPPCNSLLITHRNPTLLHFYLRVCFLQAAP